MRSILESKTPCIYEVNTWVWLSELSRSYKRNITLKNVPLNEWDAFLKKDIDAVWFMGVWERSPKGSQIARNHEGLKTDYKLALPDFLKEDIVGSPYSVREYVVDKRLGGRDGLATARTILANHNVGLILDYVPNHIALDNPMINNHPEYLVQGKREDLKTEPQICFRTSTNILAFGKDPYFPPWTDTAQLNAFSEGLRKESLKILLDIAKQCDGVRCDMAMLMINHVFKKTWNDRVENPPEQEFWSYVIDGVRNVNPRFLFMAEAYWDMEWDLQQLGFDFCYDKRLYDRLVEGNAEGVQLHLQADIEYQKKLVRFIENHDEPRSLTTFGEQRIRLAALVSNTLPGAKLIHEGQLEGHKVKLPVQLARRDIETSNKELNSFYTILLKAIKDPVFTHGDWELCKNSGWESNLDYINLISWCWSKGDGRWLIVVNMSDRETEGRIYIPWDDLAGNEWRLKDIFTQTEYIRDGTELMHQGLYVKLEPWSFHLLHRV